MTDVLVLGGGITGLTAALRLSRHGAQVTLLEAHRQLGGLGGTFEWWGKPFERFYHTTTANDHALMGLVADAGMPDQFDMHKTTMGMTLDGRHYPFSTPMDLLRFGALPMRDRIRFGAGGKSLKVLGRGKDLDNMTAEQWLRPIVGDRAWEGVLAPMFGMKFGGHMPPALYLYERLARESNVAYRAYPKAGYRGMADGLGEAIERAGGRVVTGVPVTGVRSDGKKVVVQAGGEDIDARCALSTLPIPQLKALTQDGGDLSRPVAALPDLRYMGVINLLVLTHEPVTGHYWAFVHDKEAQFQGRIEISMLTGPEHFHGLHATYVMKYLDRGERLFAEPDDVIRERWLAQFQRLHRHVHVEESFVFRTPFVEPVWPLGYLAQRPPAQVADALFMATTAQQYPMVTSWDSGVRLAERTVAAMEAVL